MAKISVCISLIKGQRRLRQINTKERHLKCRRKKTFSAFLIQLNRNVRPLSANAFLSVKLLQKHSLQKCGSCPSFGLSTPTVLVPMYLKMMK